MHTIYKNMIVITALFLFCTVRLFSQDAPSNIIQSIKSEVDRSKSELKIDQLPSPFYITYTLLEMEYVDVSASGGSLINSSNVKRRMGFPFVLVGDFFRNNANYLSFSDFYGGYPGQICLDNNPAGIANAIWSSMDSRYKSAAESFEAKKAALKQKKLTPEEEALADYEQLPPANLILSPVKMNMDRAFWENFAKKGSEVLKKYPELTSSQVNVSLRNTMAYYYDTEGGKYAVPSSYYKVYVAISGRADDGQDLNDDWYIECTSSEGIPDLNTFLSGCETFAAEFVKLTKAPLIEESYSGPVLFEKEASAFGFVMYLFKNESLLAKRKPIASPEMSRYYSNNREMRGNDLELMMGKKIISRNLNVQSLTGTSMYKGEKLDGYYPLDFQGVAPEKEMFLVEKGVLKGMLNGKTPTNKVQHSNGHMRFDMNNGRLNVCPGNVRLYGEVTSSNKELKEQLIKAAKEEDYEYAYIVRRLKGHSNDVLALYRVSVEDGQEELLRGATLADFNMKSYKRVLGVSNEEYIYKTTYPGQLAAFIVPESILFEELEITKSNNLDLKPPYVVPQPNK